MSSSPRRRQALARIGETVAGRYDLTGLLGVGGMGAVYRARHRITGHEVALKLLFPDVVQHPEAIARFLREAAAAARIRHRGVVCVMDADMDEGGSGAYLVMELLEGEDLSAVLARGDLPPERFLDIMIELLDSLDAVHRTGFVHRDIKPENVFLAREGDGSSRVKLLDFGIARCVEPIDGLHTVEGALLGTPSYMSPEQAMGRHVDARADLWSIGAMMFRAFAGRPPFDEKNVNMMIAAIIYQPAPSLSAFRPDLSPALVRFVDRALSKDPAMRWSDAATALGVLQELRRGLPESSTTLPWTTNAPKTQVNWNVPAKSLTRQPLRIPRPALMLGALIGAAFLVGIAAALDRARPEPIVREWVPGARPPMGVRRAPTAVSPRPVDVPGPTPVPMQHALAPSPLALVETSEPARNRSSRDHRSSQAPPRGSRAASPLPTSPHSRPRPPPSTGPAPAFDPHQASDSL